VDVNPFLLKRRGGVALDALVVLADQERVVKSFDESFTRG